MHDLALDGDAMHTCELDPLDVTDDRDAHASVSHLDGPAR
jgi:hypothetical protein